MQIDPTSAQAAEAKHPPARGRTYDDPRPGVSRVRARLHIRPGREMRPTSDMDADALWRHSIQEARPSRVTAPGHPTTLDTKSIEYVDVVCYVDELEHFTCTKVETQERISLLDRARKAHERKLRQWVASRTSKEPDDVIAMVEGTRPWPAMALRALQQWPSSVEAEFWALTHDELGERDGLRPFIRCEVLEELPALEAVKHDDLRATVEAVAAAMPQAQGFDYDAFAAAMAKAMGKAK